MHAQETNSNVRTNSYAIKYNQIVLDSLSIIPGSIVTTIDSADYAIDYANSIWTWKKKSSADSFTISYRVFPFAFGKRFQHKDVKFSYDSNLAFNTFEYSAIDARSNQSFVDFGSIDYAGTFGRALSFGNNQDVVLNSQFNLQMEGDLGDSITIRGAITDNTIPFQPEGNTQQIQEFDRVSIELERKESKLSIGDVDIQKPKGYFMNFYKRVQGGFYQTMIPVAQGKLKTKFGASIAKGKWVRNTLTALEGNQGPYKLTGPNGEQFFIVLAGTERVYIDGEQMERGENQDYIIDYNTAEVTFMPRRLITKDLRMYVEFEFADRNYLNSLVYMQNEYQVNDKINLRFNAYANQDAKNQSINADLSDSQIQFLNGIGDSIQLAQFPSVRIDDTFTNAKILYRKTDSVVGGLNYADVFVFSTDPDSARYSLNFTFVGLGNGDYVQSVNSANGRVYEWQAPIAGVRQGDYAPVSLLVTPKKQQMFNVGMDYRIDSNKTLFLETAMSNYDPNTFSDLSQNDNIGLAQKVIYTEKRRLTDKLNIESRINYEYVQAKFRRIERFRNVEFIRDWNVTEQEESANEHLGNVGVKLSRTNTGWISYSFGTFLRGNTYDGVQHIPEMLYEAKGLRMFASGNIINQNSLVAKTSFFRPKLEIEKRLNKFKNLTIGSKYLKERNTYSDPLTDTLLSNAFDFNVYRFYVKNDAAAKNHFSAEYMFRDDAFAKNDELITANNSRTFSLNGHILSLKNQEIRLTSAYRQMRVTDTLLSPQKADESLLGRLEYSFNFFKGILSANTLYEFGSGQEQQREFAYVEVPAGQGVYVWRDYNNDSLRQLNEFEIALFPDEKRFIKIFTPTNRYIKAKYSQFNSSLTFNPRNNWRGKDIGMLKKALSYIYLQSAIQLNNRFIGKEGIAQYNPFIFQFNDSDLINNNSSFINSFFFNRFNNKWGLDYVQSMTGGKVLLNYGIDSRRSNEHLIRGRWNINKNIAFNPLYKIGYRTFNSPFLNGRNYHIDYSFIKPAFTFLFKDNKLRITTSYNYDLRQNVDYLGGEQALSNAANIDVKYNIPGSGSLGLKSTYNNISFTGDPNSGVGYAMLDGLQNGKNWLWQAVFDKKLSKSIEMSIQYEGRKAGTIDVIHTGRASIRAIF